MKLNQNENLEQLYSTCVISNMSFPFKLIPKINVIDLKLKYYLTLCI